ncbi:AlpA family phage regulatory protein [Brevundimonas sp.]|uniref:helix-turn-helix transcriptional regulator n=1 Tax=Brevundimonas sp. TaxID=1871086 RepID=UPI0017BA9715|nr:AlpA family phage regulatory protein [Brevundimonas sp.]MBA4806234.1 AlpA family phage regulatory protein [Brevundimonas sp.]
MSGIEDEAIEPGGREDRLLSWDQVEHIASISRSTAWRMERDGAFPRRVRVSPGRVGWWESELTSWKRTRGGQLPPPPLKAPRTPRLPGMTRPMPTPVAAPDRTTPPDAPTGQGAGAGSSPANARRGRGRSGASPDQIDFGF